MIIETLGHVAYEAFLRAMAPNHTVSYMPWLLMPTEMQGAWEAAALAVAREVTYECAKITGKLIANEMTARADGIEAARKEE